MKTAAFNGQKADGRRWNLSERIWGYVLAAPAMTLVALMALAPIMAALWLSLRHRLPIFDVDEFVGLANYLDLLGDERFRAAVGTTLYFTCLSVGLELPIGLGLALLLDGLTDERTRFGRLAQTVAIVPWAVPTVVSAQIWLWLYQPDYGLLNYVLARIGVDAPIDWLADPRWAIHAAVLMDVWKTTPFAALMLLAGLKALPRELRAAARIDGAGWWDGFRSVTLPLLTPVILITLVFRTMDAVRVFDAVYVLTGGGPGNATETLSIYAYKTLFQSLQLGYGSALATAMFLISATLSFFYMTLLRRQVRDAT
jgi:multiple sugar transport system permease protein